MKMKPHLILTLILVALPWAVSANSALTSARAGHKAGATEKPATPMTPWARAKAEMIELEKKFRGKLTEDQKIALMPKVNDLLARLQSLKLSKDEVPQKIPAVVALLAAVYHVDFANSATDTVYFDYKAQKNAYIEQIKKLKESKERDGLLEAFRSWEQAEQDHLNGGDVGSAPVPDQGAVQ